MLESHFLLIMQNVHMATKGNDNAMGNYAVVMLL